MREGAKIVYIHDREVTEVDKGLKELQKVHDDMKELTEELSILLYTNNDGNL